MPKSELNVTDAMRRLAAKDPRQLLLPFDAEDQGKSTVPVLIPELGLENFGENEELLLGSIAA